MRALFSGLLAPAENADEDTGDATPKRWQCRVCCSWNDRLSPHVDTPHVSSSERASSCPTCGRPEHAPWLFLEKPAFQIRLGSLLALTPASVSESALDNKADVAAAVVVGIDFLAKTLQLVSATALLPKSADAMSEYTNVPEHHELRFRELELQYPLDFARLEPLSSNTASSIDWSQSLRQYGMCGTCRRIFRASQGELLSKDANANLVRALEAELDALRTRKQLQIRSRQYALVLNSTTEIRVAERRIRLAKRQLEFLEPLTCSFCGWVAHTSSPPTHAQQATRGE
ncbi:hypothetical protein PybrP1_009574 [[Pythium] brassicae (nom. inval.)]|nr:hypothetical protein PybrP1_009574 [[Pythium] brassicae (nom. inval.)]